MKFTFSWLKEHLDTTASLDEVVYALTDLGQGQSKHIQPRLKKQLYLDALSTKKM